MGYFFVYLSVISRSIAYLVHVKEGNSAFCLPVDNKHISNFLILNMFLPVVNKVDNLSTCP